MRLFLTFFVLMLSNGCAFSAILNGQSEFQIEKGFYAKSESPHYDFQLVLKVDRTGGVLLPASFDDAVEQLRRGIDPRIMNQSVSALTRSCEGNTFCDYSSVDMWDRFIIESENVEIEQGHTLSVYLYQMSEFIGQVWHLDKACSYEKNLCSVMKSEVAGSSGALAEILVRAAIAAESGNPATMDALIMGMGDIVQKRAAKGSE